MNGLEAGQGEIEKEIEKRGLTRLSSGGEESRNRKIRALSAPPKKYYNRTRNGERGSDQRSTAIDECDEEKVGECAIVGGAAVRLKMKGFEVRTEEQKFNFGKIVNQNFLLS